MNMGNIATLLKSAFGFVDKQYLEANPPEVDLSDYAEISYVDSLVSGVLRDRGNYDASGNTFPASGGSGSAGAIKKGDLWYISVAGTLGSAAVGVGDTVRALADTPGQTAGNWAVMENNLGYVPERSIDAASAKTTPVDSDTMGLVDSAASNVLKKVTWANIKATLKTYFDTLYSSGWVLVESKSVGTGNTVDVTGIPSDAREIKVIGTGITWNGAGAAFPLLRFIISGSAVATGYSSVLTTNTQINTVTDGIPFFWSSTTAAELIRMFCTIFCVNESTHAYTGEGQSQSSVRSNQFSGEITAAAQIGGVRLVAPGANNFDGGNIAVYYRK
jgi:hypothetical protein